jgi:hypothetical protein
MEFSLAGLGSLICKCKIIKHRKTVIEAEGTGNSCRILMRNIRKQPV